MFCLLLRWVDTHLSHLSACTQSFWRARHFDST